MSSSPRCLNYQIFYNQENVNTPHRLLKALCDILGKEVGGGKAVGKKKITIFRPFKEKAVLLEMESIMISYGNKLRAESII